MSNSNPLLRAAITGLFALGAGSIATSAFAADDHSGDEQCAGITKAGKNDCATSTNDCHGHVASDRNPMAWIYVPKGTCEKIDGAHLVKVTVPAPKKS
jgi:uncharacterized membrane protein